MLNLILANWKSVHNKDKQERHSIESFLEQLEENKVKH